ncbi:exodeoxyribonuclease V subunit gamma [Acinetobacter gerneri]|jgi:exodeoxyribonuclease V gamma subunit|uniref:exodeoxyribonuclease V subunit gamma n=1 Tax=Acinetobacter gerneri TaxID=202952 RepID=UPI0023F16E63|nr:exodeoxyribonuclease V subunit gamma [Acinetobacter gerneri]MCH4244176.1 exodeoxyribonuclease V subunit gamma [Acinetobacter gerneri]
MGIHVIQSQKIDVLVQGVMHSISSPSGHPFDVLRTQHFIVPSPAVQEWLTQKMAEQLGISANTQFHQRIRGFQWYAYQQVLDDKDKVRRANIPRLIMKWRIYQTLKSFIEADQLALTTEHPLFPIVERIYASADQLDDVEARKQKKQSMLYWVAEQVSKLFSNYMIYRGYCAKNCGNVCHCDSNWLNTWGNDQAIDIENLFFKTNQEISAFNLQHAMQLEAWQRWLWQHTFHEDYLEMLSIDQTFWQILDDPEKRQKALRQLPKQLIIFTVLDLPPSQLQFLRRLGQYLDVLILHYNPSQEYWADSVDPNWKKQYDLRVKERFIAKNPQASDQQIDQFFKQFTLNFNAEIRESRHPLLTRFGKQARDHFSILANLSSGEEGQWVDAFVDEEPTHLLAKLQSDILYLVEPEAHAYQIEAQDQSMQIHVCHSSQRQLEVLKEQLIYWLAQSTPDQPRKPSDVLVLAPNLKEIEPLIRSVFPSGANQKTAHLPVKIAGVTQLDANNAWRAVLGRIQLVQSRFSIEDFTDWLNLTATQLRYELDVNRAARMIQLLSQAGFKRGLDVEHLKQQLSENDDDFRYSFKFALDRLALGVAVPEHAVFEGVLSFSEVLSGDFELIAKLIEIYHDFEKRRDWLLSPQHNKNANSAEYWIRQLNADLTEFENAGVESLRQLREIVKKQERMLTLAYNYEQKGQAELKHMQLPLSYLLQEIQTTLDSQVEHAVPTGQVTFSQMGQIRPIPYKLVVMLNLDSGKFPNRNQNIPFDLMQILRPQLGDRSRLEDDQGAFLDALLLAQENVWMFYNGFDINDGEVREPSSVLQELLNHIAYICQAEEGQNNNDQISLEGLEVPVQIAKLYHLHPLQPFDPEGFSENKSIRFKDQWFEVANQISKESGQKEAWLNTALEPEQDVIKSLDAGQWISDITFPARLYLKTLGVENLKPEDMPILDEPLVLDGLGRYSIRDFLQKEVDYSAKISDESLSENDLESQFMSQLQDQLPIGKVQHAALQLSLAEQKTLLTRLHLYADQVTATTQRQWRYSKDLSLNITVPYVDVNQNHVKDWVSLDASSGRAKRRTKVWLEYILWLAFLDLSDEQSRELQRIAVFNDVTVVCSGVSSNQAKEYLKQWFNAFSYAQTQPLVLPAALILQPAENNKTLEWEQDDFGQMRLANFKDLLKEWDKSDAFLTYSLLDMEWSKQHRDWQFILQEQDAKALLQFACDRFAYALYQPIYEYQTVAKE